MIVAGLAALTLTGCAQSVDRPRALPPAPAWFAPVPVPALREGADAVVTLSEHRAALLKANRRLRDGRGWYEMIDPAPQEKRP